MLAFRRMHAAATEGAAVVAALCVAVTAGIYTAEVVARYFLNAPLNWSGDVSSYLLCATTFLALPKVTSDNGHIAISYFLERMEPAAQARYARAIQVVTALVCGATAVFIVIEGIQLFNEHVLTTQATQMPKWWIALLACLGISSSALHLFMAEVEGTQKDAAV
jgi:TRAP-type C4-dicarboxylate transport system permease small subunit